ncbi:MAG: hypothetical protein U1F43_01970, partial [Myxococcota bacterium]
MHDRSIAIAMLLLAGCATTTPNASTTPVPIADDEVFYDFGPPDADGARDCALTRRPVGKADGWPAAFELLGGLNDFPDAEARKLRECETCAPGEPVVIGRVLPEPAHVFWIGVALEGPDGIRVMPIAWSLGVAPLQGVPKPDVDVDARAIDAMAEVESGIAVYTHWDRASDSVVGLIVRGDHGKASERAR